MVRGRRSGEVVLSTLKKGDGSWTDGIENTMRYILDELLSVDRAEEDSEEQARKRAEVVRREVVEVGEELVMAEVVKEVEQAVKKFKNKKAPRGME